MDDDGGSERAVLSLRTPITRTKGARTRFSLLLRQIPSDISSLVHRSPLAASTGQLMRKRSNVVVEHTIVHVVRILHPQLNILPLNGPQKDFQAKFVFIPGI